LAKQPPVQTPLALEKWVASFSDVADGGLAGRGMRNQACWREMGGGGSFSLSSRPEGTRHRGKTHIAARQILTDARRVDHDARALSRGCAQGRVLAVQKGKGQHARTSTQGPRLARGRGWLAVRLRHPKMHLEGCAGKEEVRSPSAAGPVTPCAKRKASVGDPSRFSCQRGNTVS
jgi:hypothetical protein